MPPLADGGGKCRPRLEHHAKPGTRLKQMRKSGHMDEDYIKTLAATAGFRFDAESPINNNPKDTKD